MPSVKAINSLFESTLKAFPSLDNVVNNYQNTQKSESYSQNIINKTENLNNQNSSLEKIFNNQISGTEKTFQNTESFYQNNNNYSEKEKLIEKNNSQSLINEYRTSEKTTENGATHIEYNVDMTGMQNHVNYTNDIDEFLSQMTAKLETAMKSTASGVHI